MDSFRIVRLWAAAAWADGVLHHREAAALERLIGASFELSDDERQQARGFLDAAPDVSPAEVSELSPEAREGVYRAALGIVKLDRVVVDEERAFLDKLRASLDLDDATIERLESE
jgi:uncharacterized membrane protein YebE (DUF533 family)